MLALYIANLKVTAAMRVWFLRDYVSIMRSFLLQPLVCWTVFHRTSLLPPSPFSALVINHISFHFLILYSDSSLICIVPAQWLVILDAIIDFTFNIYLYHILMNKDFLTKCGTNDWLIDWHEEYTWWRWPATESLLSEVRPSRPGCSSRLRRSTAVTESQQLAWSPAQLDCRSELAPTHKTTSDFSVDVSKSLSTLATIVAGNGDCRRRRLSPSPNSATVIGSVDRA